MNNRTLKVIVILVPMLFLNIEAAHAGLVHKVKLYILHEFTDFQLIYIFAGVFLLAFFLYIIAMPVNIGKEKRVWFIDQDTSFSPDYGARRQTVKRISGILHGAPAAK
jgi:hypothetical protein